MHSAIPASRQQPPLVLDPCLLGRPVHLLPAFAAQLRDDLSTALRTSGNRRYWTSYTVGDVTMQRIDTPESAQRWVGFSAAEFSVSFSLQRHVLLNVLNHRYGRRDSAPANAAETRVTATEERLAVTLGMQLVHVLSARVDANLGVQPGAAPQRCFAGGPVGAPGTGSWTLRVALEHSGGEPGVLWLALDNALMGRVLRGLAPVSAKPKAAPAQPLAARLQLTVAGRLLSKEMALGDLLALQPGAVIPISVGRTDVLLDDTRLFTAAVAEHKGKLCLTSFEDAK